MAGKLIVFEGTDGSGKSTQFQRCCQALQAQGRTFRTIRYPRYEAESSALVRMYLGGAFGSHPDDVNAYAASTFFAVDRYAGYKEEWGSYYEAGGLMVMDRYTTSNAVHQAAKLPEGEREGFFHWLFDLEYNRMDLAGYAHPSGGGQSPEPGGSHPHPGRHPRGGHRLSHRLCPGRCSGRSALWLAAHSLCQ